MNMIWLIAYNIIYTMNNTLWTNTSSLTIKTVIIYYFIWVFITIFTIIISTIVLISYLILFNTDLIILISSIIPLLIKTISLTIILPPEWIEHTHILLLIVIITIITCIPIIISITIIQRIDNWLKTKMQLLSIEQTVVCAYRE